MRLIVCDFDNTLKVHKSSIQNDILWRDSAIYCFKYNYLGLKRAKDEGCVVVLATGRDMQSLKKAMDKEGASIQLYDFICCAEGAVTYDDTGKIVKLSSFDDDIVQCLRNIGSKDVDLVESESVGTINRVIYRNLSKESHERILNKLLSMDMIEVSYDETDIQVLPKGVNKCNAIKWIVEKMKLNEESVYCFGDSRNDMCLFTKYKGLAMRWADECLKKSACMIVDSVAEGLEIILDQDNINSRERYVFKFYDDELAYIDTLVKAFRTEYISLMNKQMEIENELDTKFDINAEKANYKKYCDSIRVLLVRIVECCTFFEGYDVNIVLTGSFSRDTAKTFSDIDISVFYENRFYPYVRKYEELLCYVLMAVFNLPRRSVHSVLLVDSIRFDEEELETCINYSNEITITLISNTGTIFEEYTVEKESISVVTRVDRADRDMRSLNSYLLFLVESNCWKEWFVNFWVLKGNIEHWLTLKKTIMEACSMKKKEIAMSIEEYRLQLKEKIERDVINSIDEYKYFYQMMLLMFFYDVRSFWGICQYQNDTIEDNIYEYLWLIRGIVKSFKKSGYKYSSHCKNQLIDERDVRLVVTRRKAMELLDMIGEINGFDNCSDEK